MSSKWIMDTGMFIPPLAACSYSKTAVSEQSFSKEAVFTHNQITGTFRNFFQDNNFMRLDDLMVVLL
jgi:hypothetical protein